VARSSLIPAGSSIYPDVQEVKADSDADTSVVLWFSGDNEVAI
jgi:hypothetical protein